MNERDRIKYERLFDTVRRNFRVTRLFTEYLERYPELITKEMIETVCDGGDTTANEAIVAILSEAFALDFDDREDRRIIMDYLTPSVRLLDKEKYEENPYYKNIRLKNVIDNDWEIRWEEYKPYQAVICDDMKILDDKREIPYLGFFPDGFSFPAILEDGNEWMTLTPVDLDTCDEAIEAAHGRVVTFGLGLGYYAYMAARKDNVESVTVVELSPNVIRLFKKHILPRMECRDKIRIVNADAFQYAEETMPSEDFDVAFVDTWRDASDGAPMYRRMKALEHLSPKTRFLYWVEGFLRSRIRAEKYAELIDAYESGNLDLPYDEAVRGIEEI